MNNIKTESDDTICRGCLSTDRRLVPLANYELYFSLLYEKQKIEMLRKPYIVVCWECAALLRRLHTFRGQVRRAHTVLEESLTTPTKDTLSRLSVRVKDKYDACFEDSNVVQEGHFRVPSIDVIKYEATSLHPVEINPYIVKVESLINKKVPPKKRKAKNKNTESKKRKASSDDPVANLKLEKSVKKARKDKTIEIEMCNVNNYEIDTDDKLDIKVEQTETVEEDHWMDDYADDRHITNENSESDYSSRDGKAKSKDDKKRIFTFKKSIVQYDQDYLSYFTEVEMSEHEMKSVLDNQVELVNKSKPYRCEFCGVSFKQRKTLDGHVNHSHRKAMHNQIKQEPDEPQRHCLYRCSLCDRMLRKEHTQAHLHECHRHKYHCLGCQWSKAFFWSKEDHSRHWQSVHAQLECDICRQTRRNTHDMERHMRASHLPIKCPQCPRVYSKWKYYRQHQKMAHPVLAQEPPESRYCVECDLQFPSIMAYKMHVMNAHRSTPKKRWPCPACNKTLNNKDTMKKHYALFHSDKTSYQCPHCGKYLSSKCSLQHHLNSHLNIKLPKDKLCSVCGRGFSTKRMLRFHTYTHTGERPYACPHCPAAFTQPNPLRVHARKQHPHQPTYKSEKARRTHKKQLHEMKEKLRDHCGKGFFTKTLLSAHINTHTGARPFVCKLCGANFGHIGHKSALYLHGRYKRKIPKKNDPTNSEEGKSGKPKKKDNIIETEKVHIEDTRED